MCVCEWKDQGGKVREAPLGGCHHQPHLLLSPYIHISNEKEAKIRLIRRLLPTRANEPIHYKSIPIALKSCIEGSSKKMAFFLGKSPKLNMKFWWLLFLALKTDFFGRK